MTLPADEFLRRFLLHVLPDGFHRIRHYGLLASGQSAANVRRARELISPAQIPDPPATVSLAPAPVVVDPPPAEDAPCPCCGGRMRVIETFLRGHAPRTVMPTPIRIDTSSARHRHQASSSPANRRVPPWDRLRLRLPRAPQGCNGRRRSMSKTQGAPRRARLGLRGYRSTPRPPTLDTLRTAVISIAAPKRQTDCPLTAASSPEGFRTPALQPTPPAAQGRHPKPSTSAAVRSVRFSAKGERSKWSASAPSQRLRRFHAPLLSRGHH